MLTAFGGALSVMNPNNEVTTIALATCAAFGLGGVIVPAATVAMIAAPDALITTCAALSLSVRAVGGAIGYSIYFNVFSGKLKANLIALVPAYAIQAGLPLDQAATFVPAFLANPAAAAEMPGITPAILDGALTGSQWAYGNSLHYVWLVQSLHTQNLLLYTDKTHQVDEHRLRRMRDDLLRPSPGRRQVPNQQSRRRAVLESAPRSLSIDHSWTLVTRHWRSTFLGYVSNCMPFTCL